MASSGIPWMLFLIFSIWLVNAEPLFPSHQTMADWAAKLDAKLEKLTTGPEDITRASPLSAAFQKAFDDGVGYTIEKPKGEEILEEMVKKVSTIFDKNIEALESLQASAEEAVRNYKYDEDLSLKKVNFTNVNEMEDFVNVTEYSRHFKDHVYREASGVQIPIEIYEGYNTMQMTKVCPTCTSVCDLCRNNLYWRRDSAMGINDAPLIKDPEILNTIHWSQELDATFKENAKRFPGVYWQSFGSQEGVLRVYPASRWRTVDDLPDLYDVRRRPWYIHGTSSPKDVVVLLDTSGSMHGQSFDIMKIAAKTLLNTLGENDFVNVAAFSRNVTWVTPCLGDGLVQANARNKRLLFDGIDGLRDRNIASFRQALDFAYRHLESFEREKEDKDGSNCHKLIMIFSDGGTESAAKIIKVYTNSTREITSTARIFTYAVGPHPLPTVVLKDMACSTGGTFTTITAMGAIRTKVQDYLRILNRPLVLSNFYNFVQTTFFSRDHLGLGFITTVTKPVFNTSVDSDNQTMAGVVGIDIPVSGFQTFAQKSHLGPLGYSFGINTNGFLIFHPSLWSVSNYLEDPVHNDLEDIEGNLPEILKLRQEMIDMAADEDPSGTRKIDVTSAVILNLGHSVTTEMEYFYAPVLRTRFSLAVALPKNWWYLNVPEQGDAVEILKNMKADANLSLAPRRFCDETKADLDSEKAEPLAEIIDKLQKQQCHGRDLNHLLFDYKTIKALPWVKDDKFAARFISSDGGVTLIEAKKGQDKKSLLKLDPYNSTLYKMALLSRTPVAYIQKHADRQIIPIYIHANQEEPEEEVEVLVNDGTEDITTTTPRPTTPPPRLIMKTQPPTVYLAQSIRISGGQEGQETVVGVSGVELKTSYFHNLMLNVTQGAENELDCSQLDIACYLVDTSGYILASNVDTETPVGDFLGVGDAQLMNHFLEKGFFKSRVEYNYQALCPTQINCQTDSASVLLSNVWMTTLELIQQFSFSIYALFITTLALLTQPSEAGGGASVYTKQVTEGLHRCTTQTQHWEWNNTEPVYHGRLELTCKDIPCVRNVHTFRLQYLNAILVVADSPQLCGSCRPSLIFDGPLEVASSEECLLPNRYRRRPDACFATHEEEVFECQPSSAPPPTASLFTLITIMLCLPIHVLSP